MKIHTFRVTGSFELQYSFTEAEVREGQATVGVAPTADALAALQVDMEACLAEQYAISSLTVEAGDLLGTEVAPPRAPGQA